MGNVRYSDRDEIARRFMYVVCIPLVRDAMIASSRGETRQLLRSIIPLADRHLFGIMPVSADIIGTRTSAAEPIPPGRRSSQRVVGPIPAFLHRLLLPTKWPFSCLRFPGETETTSAAMWPDKVMPDRSKSTTIRSFARDS